MNHSTVDQVINTRLDRRSLLKRAGILGASVPMAGLFLSACGGSDDDDARAGNEQASSNANNNLAQAARTKELTITAFDLGFDPAEVTVEAGQTLRLTFVNDGVMEHDWDVHGLEANDFTIISQPDDLSDRAKDLLDEHLADTVPYAVAGPGQEMVIEFTPDDAGEYKMVCMVPGHEQGGMTGMFIVGGEGAAADDQEETDGHVVATKSGTGTPYEAERLPNPAVAPPVGDRGPETIKVDLEIREVVAKVDEGVAYEFWTFDSTVPGTMIRARVDDTIELTLTNPPESKATHNIDLHAVTGPGGGAKATTVAPGESATIRFKALNPGAYVYHCAVAPIPHHISSGMYGLIVVEPEGGLPPVDREFYVMQGDLYLEGERGQLGLRQFSMDKMLDERPDYVTFNGSVGAIAEESAFKANVGETIRIFFGVGGPNLVSSFHIIGEIFDQVMQEGASEWATNVQTTLVPAGGATVVEFTAEVPGTYMLVDHSLGRLAKGAVGMIEVAGDENPEVFEIVATPGA